MLDINDDAHTLTARLVVGIADAGDLALLDELGNVLDELLLVDTIGYLGNDDAVVAFFVLYFSLGTDNDAPAPCGIGILDSLQTVDVGTGGEVGSLNILHEAVDVDFGIVDVSAATVNHFAEVVGGDVGSHTDSNTVAAVDKQVGHLGWHDGGLDESIVEVVGHVNSVLVEVVHYVLSHLREAALSVTHGCRRVAVDGAEVTLRINEGVTHVPLLPHADEGTVDGTVAVRMILSEHLTHDAGTFLVGFVTGVADVAHGIEYAAVNGLEAVTNIWQRPGHYDRHGIVDIEDFISSSMFIFLMRSWSIV